MSQIFIEQRIWIDKDGKSFLGSGRITLLEAIEQYGSISKAAVSMGMSYNKAWNLIDSMNRQSEIPIVTSESGGDKGGGTKLTAHGKKIIDEFRWIEVKSKKFIDRQIRNCCIY